jgi:hypothetical protein
MPPIGAASMPNPLNPLNWITSAQAWFSKTEKSSGFRPYLIFLIIHAGFSLVLLSCFPRTDALYRFIVNSLYVSFIGFVGLFIIKAFQDPNFCRSEKHVQTVRRMEMEEQKGDAGPTLVPIEEIDVIPEPQQLPPGSEDAE